MKFLILEIIALGLVVWGFSALSQKTDLRAMESRKLFGDTVPCLVIELGR